MYATLHRLIIIWSLHRSTQCSFTCRDRSIDVLCLVETWHDTNAVCFRRLRSVGFQVTDRPRPRPRPRSAGESSSLSTNHGECGCHRCLRTTGGVAVVAVSGVRLSSFDASAILLRLSCCVLGLHSGNPPASSLLYIVLAWRPSSLRSSMTYRTLSTHCRIQ